MSPTPIAHVMFPRPSVTRPLPEFAWDAAKALADSDAWDVEILLPVPVAPLRRLSSFARRARGARPWPDGLEDTLRALAPSPTLVPFVPIPGRSTESAAAAVAAHLIARPRDARPRLLHGSFLDEGGFVAAWAGKTLGCPSVAVAHGSDAAAAANGDDSNGRRRRVLATLRHASEIVAVSTSMTSPLAKLGRRAEIIRYTACARSFGLAPRKRGRPVVLFVGRVERAKGVHLLLEAFALLQTDAVLELVGRCTGDVDVPAMARNLGIADRVTVLGELSREALVTRYRRCACVALPSLAEGLPCVLVEALLVGRPVIATDVGGVAELVNDQVGRLVPPGDAAALTGALDQVLEQIGDPQWSPRALRQHALPMSWDAMLPRLEALTSQLIRCASSS